MWHPGASETVEGRVLLVFVDGLGLAAPGPGNPLAVHASPALERLLGGPLVAGTRVERRGLLLRPIDACLGIEGLPQSATGQTALFTGVNAAERLGRHVASFPGPRLRALIEAHGLLRDAREAGRSVSFANAFTPAYFESVAARRRRASVTVISTQSAAVPFLGTEALRERRALSWDLCRDLSAPQWEPPLERLSAREAATDLAALAATCDLTVYETFLPDLVGHRRMEVEAAEVVARLDALIGGLVGDLAEDTTLVLTSDHGNFEEAEHRRHTRNPVPLLAVGPAATQFSEASSLVDIAPGILGILGVMPGVVLGVDGGDAAQ